MLREGHFLPSREGVLSNEDQRQSERREPRQVTRSCFPTHWSGVRAWAQAQGVASPAKDSCSFFLVLKKIINHFHSRSITLGGHTGSPEELRPRLNGEDTQADR